MVAFMPPLWEAARAEWTRRMAPVMVAAYLAGARDAARRMGQKADDPALDLAALNQTAAVAVADELNTAWMRIERTSREAVANAIQRNIGAGLPGVRGVARDLREIFGRDRAELIAVTEVTNVMGRGALAQYRAMGADGWEWLTVVDDRVCPVCEGREGQVFGIDEPFEAAHPRCRCRPAPVVE